MGLDIGSSKVCACICEVSPTGEIHVCGTGSAVTNGLYRGRITHLEELLKSVEKAVQRAELSAGARVDQVITNLPLYHTSFIHNVGVILSKEESGTISESEKIECMRRSKNIPKSSDQTVIHMIPLYFKVDEAMVQNPVGVKGTHLEAKTHIITVDSETLHKTTLLLRTLRLRITGLVYDGLASAQVLLSDVDQKAGAIVFDIGAAFSKVSIFKNGLLQRASVIPIGGMTITQDIAQCLKVSLSEAERLKVLYGHVNHSQINPGEYLDVASLKGERVSIQRKLLCQIIHARVTEWMSLIQNKMSFDFDPHYQITFGGRGSLLSGLDRFVESKLNRKVNTLLPESIRQSIEGPEQATAIGLIIYGLKSKAIALSPPPLQNDPFKKLNSWFKEFF